MVKIAAKERIVNTENIEIQQVMDIVQKEMSGEELELTLKLRADSIKRTTYQKLLDSDEDAKRQLEHLNTLRRFYKRTSFTKKQRRLVETIIARNDELNWEYVQNAYRAGMIDGYRVLRAFDLTRE